MDRNSFLMENIKVAFIGIGYRGKQLLRLMQNIPTFTIVAIADPGIETPQFEGIPCYHNGTEDYKNMLREHCPQLVVIACPWKYQVEYAIECLNAGCHIAVEIKGGLCLNEYQPVIDLSEKLQLRVYPLENTVFMQENLAIFTMVSKGILGEVVYMRGGYRHDLRDLLIDDAGCLGNPHVPEGSWRSTFYQTENGDLYPTHGLAPLCVIAGINRQDKIKYLTSFASKAKGIQQRIKDLGGDTNVKISTGDVVVTQLETESGVLITLTHDTTLPRPRSLDFEVQGTKGIWDGDNRKIYIEGLSPWEKWEPDQKYIDQYEHQYWKMWGKEALEIDTHHRGMDFIMLKALEADMLNTHSYPTHIRDLALWTSVSPYSKLSISERRTISMD